MLVLRRKAGESIVIDGGIEITVLSVGNQFTRIGIAAPKSVMVHRKEVNEKLVENTLNGEPVDKRPVICGECNEKETV